MAAFVDTEKKLASICFICKTQNKTNTAQLLKNQVLNILLWLNF